MSKGAFLKAFAEEMEGVMQQSIKLEAMYLACAATGKMMWSLTEEDVADQMEAAKAYYDRLRVLSDDDWLRVMEADR